MYPVGRRRGRRESSAVWGWYALAAACVALFAGIGYSVRSNHVPIDQATLCRTDASPASVTVVLLDTTDRLDGLVGTQVNHAIERIREGMPTYGLLQLYTVGIDGLSPEPLLSLCNPGRGAQMNPLYQNPKLAEQRWATGFRDRIDAVLASAMDAEAAAASPLLEGLRDLAIRRLDQPVFDGVPKSLIVVSDLLQHSDLASHYREVPAFASFRQSPAFARVQAPLRNVAVEVFYVARPERAALQSKAHVQFWNAYFTDSGAELVAVRRVLGG